MVSGNRELSLSLFLMALAVPSTVMLAQPAASAQPNIGSAVTDIRQLHVTAAGPGDGDGTQGRPFVLTRGREYELNRLIGAAASAASAVEIVFDDGIYGNVQLRIIRQGIDSDSVYSPDSAEQRRCSSVEGPKARADIGCRCNQTGGNCRVRDADFTLAAHDRTRLTFRARNRGHAIFDGSALARDSGLADATALTVAGSHFGIVPSAIPALASQPMSRIEIDGLAFRNYRNGILVDFAADIVVRNCTLAEIGSGGSAGIASRNYGAFAIGLNGNSTRILFIGNSVENARDVAPAGAQDQAIPSLMHGIYLQNSHDVFFIDNRFIGSSGPMIKFSDYAGDQTHPGFAAGAAARRSFFIGNLFELSRVSEAGRLLPVFSGQQAFIEDNAVVSTPDGPSAPTAGAVFLNNEFRNRLPDADTEGKVSFLRQELPPGTIGPLFPLWRFMGTTISGVDGEELAAFRRRGQPIDTSSIKSGAAARGALERTGLLDPQVKLSRMEIRQTLTHLIRGPLASGEAAADDAALAFAERALDVSRK